MFALHKIHAALFSLLFLMLALAAFNARAALPDAGTSIGTQAVVTFSMGGIEGSSTSNLVTTTIAQVYETKIVALNGAVLAQPKGNADMRFAIRNIGNGIDNVTFSAKDLPASIDSVIVYRADDNGVAESVGTEINKTNNEKITLSGMSRDETRNVVVRMTVPAAAKEGTEYKFEFETTNGGKNTQLVKGAVRVVADVPFDIEAGDAVLLDAGKNALVAFKVIGKSPSNGYFELIVAKKPDLSRAPVRFNVQKQRISFDNNDIALDKMDAKETMTKFVVDNMPENRKTDFKMNINVPDAVVGDEFVMFVKYSKADTSAKIASLNNQLTTSTEVQISYMHTMAEPVLTVTGNSSVKPVDPNVIVDAVSGDTYYYYLALENKSSADENFSLELDNAKAKSVRNMTFEDENGNAFSAAGGSGLPETGVIPAGKTIKFRVKVDLAHAEIHTAKQEMKVIAKAITQNTAPASAILQINGVKKIPAPTITFFADQNLGKEINTLEVPGRDNFASFYMKVEAPEMDKNSNNPRQYDIKFDQQYTTFQLLTDNTVGPEFPAMSAAIGHGAKARVFLVKVDMRNNVSADGTATATDVLGQVEGKGTIKLTKQAAVAFAEPGYAANGSVDLDTVLTVNVINRGSDIDARDYEVLAGENVEANDWKIAFSTDGINWTTNFELPKMMHKASQAVQVKVTVPKNANAGASQSLNLVLRKTNQKAGSEKNESTTVVTVTIGKSQLEIVKKLSVVKVGNKSTVKPSNFSESTGDEVAHADSVWYQVEVTNPFDAPVAKNVIITDPLPKHSVFVDGSAGTEPTRITVNHIGDNVVMKLDEMQPDSTVIMYYRVTIKLQ